MFGLVVMEGMTPSGHLSNINPLYSQYRRPCIALFKFKVEYRVKDKIILLQVVQTNMSPALTNNDLIVPNLPTNGKKMIDTVIDIDVDSAYK